MKMKIGSDTEKTHNYDTFQKHIQPLIFEFWSNRFNEQKTEKAFSPMLHDQLRIKF